MVKKLLAVFTALSIPFLSSCSELDALFLSQKEIPADSTGLNVYFLDVGQADSTFIECDGEKMMIDGGNVGDSSYVVSFLKKQNTEHLKYVFGTHGHEDHIGGLSGALSQCTADSVFCSSDKYSSKAFKNFAAKAETASSGITIPNVGDTYSLGSSTITVLGPVEKSENENDNSIMLRLDYGNTSFIFTGDAEFEEEKSIIESGTYLDADVLKVGHHGSSTSSSYRFLREVMPDYAVISVGKDNTYGHPHEETLSRLSDEGASVYRTDKSGIIQIHSDGNEISVSTER